MFDLDKNKAAEAPENDNADFLKDVFSRRIRASDVIKVGSYIMRIDGVNKISKDNISGFIGKAKARKSFAVAMFAGALAGGLNLYNKFYVPKAQKVLYADTEQSTDDVHLVCKRINELAGGEGNLLMYPLKRYNPKQRIVALEGLLEFHRPDVLIIDGLKDLIYNINDAVECTDVMSMLQRWNVDFDIHIAVVLHQNKGDGNARGHVGTELDNKSQAMFRITQDENDKRISEFREIFGRGKGTDAFEFFVNNEKFDFGVPEVIESSIGDVDVKKAPF